jgi:hypothetical protein
MKHDGFDCTFADSDRCTVLHGNNEVGKTSALVAIKLFDVAYHVCWGKTSSEENYHWRKEKVDLFHLFSLPSLKYLWKYGDTTSDIYLTGTFSNGNKYTFKATFTGLIIFHPQPGMNDREDEVYVVYIPTMPRSVSELPRLSESRAVSLVQVLPQEDIMNMLDAIQPNQYYVSMLLGLMKRIYPDFNGYQVSPDFRVVRNQHSLPAYTESRAFLSVLSSLTTIVYSLLYRRKWLSKPTLVFAFDDPTLSMSTDNAKNFAKTLLYICQVNDNIQVVITSTHIHHWIKKTNLSNSRRDDAFSVVKRVSTGDEIIYETVIATKKSSATVYYLRIN